MSICKRRRTTLHTSQYGLGGLDLSRAKTCSGRRAKYVVLLLAMSF